MAEAGFFERWGKRKAAARQGFVMPEPPSPLPTVPALKEGADAPALAAVPTPRMVVKEPRTRRNRKEHRKCLRR